MKYIYYIGNFDFYEFNVQAQLVLSNGKILRDIGYEVVFIGSTSNKKHSEEPLVFEGFNVYHIQFNKTINDLLKWKKADNEIKKIMNEEIGNIKAIIMYSSPAFAIQMNSLSKWSKENKIKFIANCADLSDTSHGNYVDRIVKTLDLKWKNYMYAKHTDGIISVSNYISEYFSEGNSKKIVVIPPLKDCTSIKLSEYTSTDMINLVYAGTPFPVDGRKVSESAYKDRLDIILENLDELVRENQNINFKLDVYGLDVKQYLNVITNHQKLIDRLKKHVYFHGKVTNKLVQEAINKADFTINFRDVNQMTMAGFSTKFVESISCGTPVITTKTSDLEKYLVEGENGFFIDINNRTDSLIKLEKIFSMSSKEISNLKMKCYHSKVFDYRNFIRKMDDFLNEV